MPEETQEVTNHSDTEPVIEQDPESESLYAEFGLNKQQQPQKEIEFPTMEDPMDAPTIEQTEEEPAAETRRTLKLKYNGEEKDVDEEEARTLAQKGMNYDKVQSKLQEQQNALDELAQLQGYKDHAELLAKLPELKEQRKQQKESEYDTLRQSLRDEALEAGLDPDKLEQYLDNHPIMQESKRILASQQLNTAKSFESEILSKWDEMYKLLPEESDKPKLSFKDGILHFDSAERPAWYTADIQAKIERGYDPVDAYKLANEGKTQAQVKKQTEQRIIKEQQLGARSQVQGSGSPDVDQNDLSPAQMALAEEYGISLDAVRKQQKILNNRR
jgi:hypothetical protein